MNQTVQRRRTLANKDVNPLQVSPVIALAEDFIVAVTASGISNLETLGVASAAIANSDLSWLAVATFVTVKEYMVVARVFRGVCQVVGGTASKATGGLVCRGK